MPFISPLCQLFMRSIRLSNSAVKRFELPKALSEFLINIISSKAQCAPLNSSLIESGEIVPSLFFVVVVLLLLFFAEPFIHVTRMVMQSVSLAVSLQCNVSCCVMYSAMSLAVSCAV